MAKTSIEWTASTRPDGTTVPGYTFNPWHGCMKVSDGCKHCYAETLNNRFRPGYWGPPATTPRLMMSNEYWRHPVAWNRKAGDAGERRKVFCASMADVFEDHPDVGEARQRLWELVEATPHLDWLLLTKRPENILPMVPYTWVRLGAPGNVWLGTSVENQQMADKRIPELVLADDQLVSTVAFLSCEPLLGPLSLMPYLDGIDWVIVGGESGPKCRPMDFQCPL